MALRNPTQAPRVVPFAEVRRSTDVLPNGRPAFRVTQRFADTDRFLGGLHGAIDLGNFNCGDALLASVSGYVQNRRDIYGALIVEIVEASADVVGYGHLSSFARANGSYVLRGTVIGYVGDTGLGNVCHCHFYRRLASGRLVDPWWLLEQNAIVMEPPSSTVYGKFNAGVDGVNIRTSPDSRKANVYAVAFADTDPKPNGIYRLKADGTLGARLGSTSSRRILKRGVTGPDGVPYFEINLGGGTFVAQRFMHRV